MDSSLLQTDVRLRSLVVGLLLIGILPRYRAVVSQHAIAAPRDARQFLLCLRVFERGMGLGQLLFGLREGGAPLGHLRIQIGSLDFGQKLTLAHMVADIRIAALYVPG